jgi:glycosyltransferase involved in cell wall biosynthesis
MATSLPCIVSSSGGLPYEVDDIGDVVPEKDPGALQKAMLRRFENQEEGRDQGRRLCERLQHTFEMRHLNRCFVTVMKDILAGRFNPDHADQTRFEFEAQVVES